MADPTKYVPGYDFSDFSAHQPNTQQPGDRMDVEFENISDALGGAVDAIKDIRRSDGALKNQIVTFDSLAANLKGPFGQGVPIGGAIAKVLAKKSGSDYDTEWVDAVLDHVVTDVKFASSSSVFDLTTLSQIGAVGDGVANDGLKYVLAEQQIDQMFLPTGKTFFLDNVMPSKQLFGRGGLRYKDRAGSVATVAGIGFGFDPVRSSLTFAPNIWAEDARSKNLTPGLSGPANGIITSGGAGYVDGEYTNVPLTNISVADPVHAAGATGNFVVRGGVVIAYNAVLDGANYTDGDILGASAVNLGGAGAGLTLKILPSSYFNTVISPGSKLSAAARSISRSTIYGTANAEAAIELERVELFGNAAGRFMGFGQRSGFYGATAGQWSGQKLDNDPDHYFHDWWDGGASFVAGVSSYDFGPEATFTPVNLSGATNSNPAVTPFTQAVFTTSSPHGLKAGHMVRHASVGGMTEMNGITYKVSSTPTPTTYTLNALDADGNIAGALNTLPFGTYTSGGTVSRQWDFGLMETRNPGIRALLAASVNTVPNGPWATSTSQVTQNYGLGRDALLHFIKGVGNSAFGYQSLTNMWIGDYNTAFGRMAGRDTVFYTRGAFFGNEAGATVQQGNYSVFLGPQSGYGIVQSSSSVFLGRRAGGGLPTTLNDALIIQNDNLRLPLIAGDFANLKVGINTTPAQLALLTQRFQLHGAVAADTSPAFAVWATSAAAKSTINHYKSKNATIGTQTLVVSGEDLGAYRAHGSDGAAFVQAFEMLIEATGTPSAGIVPGRATFSVMPAAGGALVDQVRIAEGMTLGTQIGSEKGVGTLNISGSYYVGGNKIIGAAKTGWGVPTGTLARTTFATYAGQTISASPTQAQVQAIDDHLKILSQRLAANINDTHVSGASSTHGLLAA